jgi:O-6-methylguanine DNA methyltransferase
MQCRTVLTRIDALRTGELPNPDEKPIHEHLKKCKSCEDSVDDLRELAGAVKALAVAPPRSVRTNVKAACCDSFDTVKVNGKTVRVAFTDRGLRMIHLGESEDALRVAYARRFRRDVQPSTLPEKLRRQIVAALSGEGVDKPAVDLDDVSEFERSVLEILTRIPRGEVRTYAWVAKQAGKPKAIRAVGNICARNIVPFVVPCHRVVPTGGGIGRYAFGSPLKRELLKREGVPVEELDALASQRVRYIGSRTTKIFCFPTCGSAMRIQDANRVPFHDAAEAKKKGFRPCQRCQPIAA